MIYSKGNIKKDKNPTYFWFLNETSKNYKGKVKLEDPKKDGKKMADISTSKNNHILEKNYNK